MKKIIYSIAFILTVGNTTFGQSMLILPTGNGSTAQLNVVSTTQNATNNTASFFNSAIGLNYSHIHYGTTGDWYIRSAANGGKVILQDNVGNVGIGNANPTEKLDVTGRILSSALAGTGTRAVKVTANGVLTTSASMTSYLSIPLVSFVNDGGGAATMPVYINGAVYLASGTNFLIAPMHLPHGAVITNIRFYFVDADAINNLSFRLQSYPVAGNPGSFTYDAIVSSTGASAPATTQFLDLTPPTNYTIDNLTKGYLVIVSPVNPGSAWTGSVNLAIRSVVVTYTI